MTDEAVMKIIIVTNTDDDADDEEDDDNGKGYYDIDTNYDKHRNNKSQTSRS